MSDDSAWAPRREKPAQAPSTPDLLPGYVDATVVARGGDSVVYRAHQQSVDRDVAIKVVQSDDARDDPEALARFGRELEITVRLGRQHPNIMTVLAVGTTNDGYPCLVMDYFELGSLHDRLRTRGPLPVSEVVAAGSVIADALGFAHNQGVLHRDVKPQNVLVLPTSYVLADFGLARAIDAGHSASLERFSYRHASPQILDGAKPTVADDIYSLGSTLFTLLDGRAPFAADDPDEDSALSYLRRARTEAPRTLDRDDLPPGLVDVITQCLAKEPSDRFADAAALRDALAQVPTEQRRWAPASSSLADSPANRPANSPGDAPPEAVDEAPAEAPVDAPTDAPVDAPVDAPTEPDPTVERPPPPAPEPPESPQQPERVAVSALAHLEADRGGGRVVDADATGRRPEDHIVPPPLPPEPESHRYRWLIVAAAAVLALAAGVIIGVVNSGQDNSAARPDATPKPTPTPTSSTTVTVPVTSAAPTGIPSASPVLDSKLAPTITALSRRPDNRVDLRWKVPIDATVLIFLDDDGTRSPLARIDNGSTAATLTDVSAGRHCFRLATVTINSDSKPVFGLSARRCVRS